MLKRSARALEAWALEAWALEAWALEAWALEVRALEVRTSLILAIAALGLACQPASAAGQEPPNLRDALFGAHVNDRHFGAAPPVARYEVADAEAFVLDRQPGGMALMKFDNSGEILALTATSGPRGDLIYRNDMGEPVLRASRLGGVTVFTSGQPGGMAAALAGQAQTLRPPSSIGPDALLHSLSQASARASRAAQHLVLFEAPEVAAASDWVFADAAALAADAFLRLASQAPAGRTLVSRFLQVTFTPGPAPRVQAAGSVVQIVVTPQRGVAGRPSSARIYTVISRR